MPTESAIYAWVLFGSLRMIYWGYGKMKELAAAKGVGGSYDGLPLLCEW